MEWLELLCFMVDLKSIGRLLTPWMPRPVTPPTLVFCKALFLSMLPPPLGTDSFEGYYALLIGGNYILAYSSSEENVWLEALPSPLMISFNSGNFLLLGSTFFLSNFFIP